MTTISTKKREQEKKKNKPWLFIAQRLQWILIISVVLRRGHCWIGLYKQEMTTFHLIKIVWNEVRKNKTLCVSSGQNCLVWMSE